MVHLPCEISHGCSMSGLPVVVVVVITAVATDVVVTSMMVVSVVVVSDTLVELVVVTVVVGSDVLVVSISVVVERAESTHIFHPVLLTVLSLVQVMSPDGTTLLGPVLPL
jgi:hypothetical protein